MNANSDEKLIAEWLAEKNLRTERFTKEERGKSKTPDFRVFSQDEFAFYCEVKTVLSDIFIDESLNTALKKTQPGTIVSIERHDPIFNRLTDDVHTAVKQFDAVNRGAKYFNVLAFVNHDKMCDFNDLREILTGDFYAEGGKCFPISRNFSEGRIREEKKRIHLYLWLDRARRKELDDRLNRHHLIFNVSKEDEQKQSRFYEYFGRKPDSKISKLQWLDEPLIFRSAQNASAKATIKE